MIGHGHIDPTWLWRWTEGYEEVRATFRSALDRMREVPDFTFTASSACFYAWFRESEPERFAEVQARVAEGRWEIAGGWWLEPDCNVPTGEALVRHGLYGQRFFQQHFGKRARVGFNPDSFGHAGGIPQLLVQLGLDCYLFMRPMAGTEKDYPAGNTFYWESPDGSRVLTSNILESYNADEELAARLADLPANRWLNKGQQHLLCFYGVGNHGGGPTRRAIAAIQQAQATGALPRPEFSTLAAFIDAFAATTAPEAIPTIQGELQHHARGCYTAHAGVKRLNRRAEHALLNAERLATWAAQRGLLPYPAVALEAAWKSLLYNQFHDILAGTSIPSSYEDTAQQLGGVLHTASYIQNQAIQVISREIDTTPEGNTIVVFNPLPWPVTAPVMVSEIAERTLAHPIHLADADGNAVPLQAVAGERVGGKQFAFVAALPSLGYCCFHLRGGARVSPTPPTLRATHTQIENRWWTLDIDPSAGGIAGLRDRLHAVDVLPHGAALVALVDASDTWSHGVEEWRVERGRFGAASARLVESGPVLATVRTRATFGASTAIVWYTLYEDSPIIDVRMRINWQEAHTFLKWSLDTGIEGAVPTAETAYGHTVRRGDGKEEPAQQWVDITGRIAGQAYGLAVLNDGVYAYDATGAAQRGILQEGAFGIDEPGAKLRISLLRSPAYAHHDPARYQADSDVLLMDQGWHEFHFRVLPHAGPWQQHAIPHRAWELNARPVAHVESAHGGGAPAVDSFVDAEASGVLLSVIKPSEDGLAVVLRGFETLGAPATLSCGVAGEARRHSIAFGAHEVKTLLVTGAGLVESNLLEDVPGGSMP